jgi:Fur family iron response transcriptional regulator
MQRADILVEFSKYGILPTAQRLEVAGILLAKPQHLSAEQIIDRLRINGSGLSKATVYNTLNLFRERGLVNECLVDPERRFYDSTTEPHHHFYNMDTGELTDIPQQNIQISGLPDLPDDFHIDGIEVVIKGRGAPPKDLA